ncbi:MAG: ABC transporter permease [Candidatus Dadabacteria bacterium]|nr:MAG: ABC transporter permease [Candidatus Dadabacteria bacterium]
MNDIVQNISLIRLTLMLIPVAVVFIIFFRWQTGATTVVYATIRMIVQLILVGYLLSMIFNSNSPLVIGLVLLFMLLISAWIAIRPLKEKNRQGYFRTLWAISIGSLPVLALVTQAALRVQPWYEPRFIIPLAGMIFSNSMNAVSLALERYGSEIASGTGFLDARAVAYRASLIPITNALFAVGLVSLPGMMTGQILSGVSPLIAARYQIVVMCMIFGSAGISSAVYLSLAGGGLNES